MMRTWKNELAGILLVVFMAVLLISGFSPLPVSAAEDLPRLVDDADLLSDGEEKELSDKLDEISERQQVDVVVVTVNALGGKTAMEYADDFYDDNGYGYGEEKDGILFLISMEERDWHMSTSGFGITAFTDEGLEYISDYIMDDLSGGDYIRAFMDFADLCDEFITQAYTDEAFDVDNLPQEPFEPLWSLLTAFCVAFVIALIATGIMKGKLKSVYEKSEADHYMKQNSMKLTKKKDLFLYKNVERRRRQEDDSLKSSGGSTTHTSASGRTHGGSGGKF